VRLLTAQTKTVHAVTGGLVEINLIVIDQNIELELQLLAAVRTTCVDGVVLDFRE